MSSVFIESIEGQWAVYAPGTSQIVFIVPSLVGALAYARAEWPELPIRVVRSVAVRDLAAGEPPQCPTSG